MGLDRFVIVISIAKFSAHVLFCRVLDERHHASLTRIGNLHIELSTTPLWPPRSPTEPRGTPTHASQQRPRSSLQHDRSLIIVDVARAQSSTPRCIKVTSQPQTTCHRHRQQ